VKRLKVGGWGEIFGGVWAASLQSRTAWAWWRPYSEANRVGGRRLATSVRSGQAAHAELRECAIRVDSASPVAGGDAREDGRKYPGAGGSNARPPSLPAAPGAALTTRRPVRLSTRRLRVVRTYRSAAVASFAVTTPLSAARSNSSGLQPDARPHVASTRLRVPKSGNPLPHAGGCGFGFPLFGRAPPVAPSCPRVVRGARARRPVRASPTDRPPPSASRRRG
jgi:hypothetical protein